MINRLLGGLSIGGLALIYISGFIIPKSFTSFISAEAFGDILLLAAPTIPVLFLCSLLTPNALSRYYKKSFLTSISCASSIAIIVLLTASYLYKYSPGSLYFNILPSALGALAIFFYYSDIPFGKRLQSWIIVSLMTSPYIGVLVVLFYSAINNIWVSRTTLSLYDGILLFLLVTVLIKIKQNKFGFAWNALAIVLYLVVSYIFLVLKNSR